MKEEIVFGNYNGKPLVWLPLYKKQKNSPYILKESICKMKFDEGISGYMNSSIRKFLLEKFATEAFSDGELLLLENKKERFNDIVWLLPYEEFNITTINKKIFKESAWWLGSQVSDTDFSDVVWGSVWKFGFQGDVSKNCEYGVRPCIQFKKPPQF